MGLKRYEIHKESGVISSLLQSENCFTLSMRSANHKISDFLE